MHQRYRRIIASALDLSSCSLFIPTAAQAGYSDYESFHLVRADNSPRGRGTENRHLSKPDHPKIYPAGNALHLQGKYVPEPERRAVLRQNQLNH